MDIQFTKETNRNFFCCRRIYCTPDTAKTEFSLSRCRDIYNQIAQFQCILHLEIIYTLKLFAFFSFFKFYLFIFRQRRREGERGKHQCVVASRAPPTGDLACKTGTCPDWESNQRPFGSQAGTQSTEPSQPGHIFLITFKKTLSIPLPHKVILLPTFLSKLERYF